MQVIHICGYDKMRWYTWRNGIRNKIQSNVAFVSIIQNSRGVLYPVTGYIISYNKQSHLVQRNSYSRVWGYSRAFRVLQV